MNKQRYSISELERMTGVKAHTIRVWEKRYGIVEPLRTQTNIRSYSDEELKKLLNVSILNNSGWKISQIAELSDEQIGHEVFKIATRNQKTESLIERMIHATLTLDSMHFNKVITHAVITHGFEDAFQKVFFPFHQKIQLLWLSGTVNVAQQHFADSILRQKVIVALDGLMMSSNPNGKRFFIFLPEGHYHELCMLFFAYLVRKSGHRSIYLGQSVTEKALVSISETKPPDAFVTTFSSPISHREMESYLTGLSHKFPHKPIYVARIQRPDNIIDCPLDVRLVHSAEDFKADILIRFPL